MALSHTYTQPKKTRTKKTVECKPKGCPTCGAQECIERPRFFCGQLLTDKDLDLAQRYVIEKNRLHNRYLVGDGVVCGLAVSCDPCDGCSVMVAPGYAIDCCGNDLIVCEPAPFDVCDYIDKCLRKKEPGCEDKFNPNSRCDDQPRDYCLVISYNEEQSTPVTALMRDNGCKNTRCEPSRTKETFRFDLISEEDHKKKTADDIVSRVTRCIDLVAPEKGAGKERTLIYLDEFEEADKTSDPQTRHANIYRTFCRLRDHIRNIYEEHNVRCDLAEELRGIDNSFPASSQNANYSIAIFSLYARLLQFLKDCLCEALLVPCAPCEDEGVVLACLTIENGKITNICNVARKFVITGPALRYWLGPVFNLVGDLVERLCCEIDFSKLFDGFINQREMPQQPVSGLRGGQPAGPQSWTMPPQDFVSGLKRVNTLQRMLSDYAGEIRERGDVFSLAGPSASSALNNLRTLNAVTLFDTNSVSAVDLYGKSASEAKEILKTKSEPTIAKTETRANAYATTNLAEMNWAITEDSEVELVVDKNDRVTAVRVSREARNK